MLVVIFSFGKLDDLEESDLGNVEDFETCRGNIDNFVLVLGSNDIELLVDLDCEDDLEELSDPRLQVAETDRGKDVDQLV